MHDIFQASVSAQFTNGDKNITKSVPTLKRNVSGHCYVVTPEVSKIIDSVSRTFLSPEDQQEARKNRAFTDAFTDDLEALRRFATATKMPIVWLKAEGKRLGLVITLAGRQRHRSDRVGFGLRSKVKASVEANLGPKFERTLFKFGLRKDGFFHPSESSNDFRVSQSMIAT